MTDDLSPLIPPRRPTAQRPLLGLTVLVVEDSRFASEALRLMCLRSGARIRRADTLASARRHLSLYRPAAVIVDLGLPDGSGAELIAELDRASPRVPVILGTSGASGAAAEAAVAGAQGFLEKPVADLAAFQEAILAHLPAEMRPAGPRPVGRERVEPDRIALRDDLSQISGLLAAPADAAALAYAAQFLASLAAVSGDGALARAAEDLAAPRSADTLRDVHDLVARRLRAAGTL